MTKMKSAPQLVNDPPDTPDALDALESQTATSPPAAPDPFDLDFLRFDPSLTEGIGVRKVLNTVPVRKPNPQDFIRVHPDPAYRLPLAVIERCISCRLPSLRSCRGNTSWPRCIWR